MFVAQTGLKRPLAIARGADEDRAKVDLCKVQRKRSQEITGGSA
tara:strand:- start:9 stop:140 length:132 start_codon:yes stop_codon:yes gene_type:complete